MDYRKYRARTFQEAKLKMMLDVGNRAYMVSQRKVREGGLFGLFGKRMVEITAGIMIDPSESGRRIAGNQVEMLPENRMDPDLSIRRQIVRETESQMDQLIQVKQEMKKQEEPSDERDLRSELDEIKSLISKILTEKELSPSGEKQSPETIGSQRNSPGRENNDRIKELIKLLLKEEDFDEDFINIICSLSSLELYLSKESNLSKIKEYLKVQISEIIETTSGINIDSSQSNVIVVVGPTGVGKTTTLAKLGAYFGVFQKKKVKFISIDTYRVGAIQQLKLYADIMEIPFAKVNNVEELRMELFADDCDLVLVDTTGRSQKNLDEIRDIKKYLDVLGSKVHISLAISATTKYKDLVEILEKFDILNYTNIIITKLDETNSLGQVISAISPKKRSLSYVTFGQSVPEDIEEASKEKLFEMVLKA